MSEDLESKQVLEVCQTENYSHCQLSENSGFKQESRQSAHKILQPCIKDHWDKMLVFSQPISEVQSVLGLHESQLLKVQWHRSVSSRNYNVLPQNVINLYKAIPVTWSSLTFTDLIYISIHILSRPPKHPCFLQGNMLSILSSLIITTSIYYLQLKTNRVITAWLNHTSLVNWFVDSSTDKHWFCISRTIFFLPLSIFFLKSWNI